MKILIAASLVLVLWLTILRTAGFVTEGISPEMVDIATALLIASCLLASLTTFARAGKLRFEPDHLAIRTPAGTADIPYARIETIRRCRSRRYHRLEIVFQSLGELKVLRVSPGNLTQFAEALRSRCPHLSSASTGNLVRQSGYRELIRKLS